MKAENVTSQRDPEFFALMVASTDASLRASDAALEAERHCTQKTMREMRWAKRKYQNAREKMEALAKIRGYII